MRTPRPANTAIDARRRLTWQRRFGSYRYGVTEAGILDWLDQFHDADKDTAARLLDSVEFISAEQLGDKQFAGHPALRSEARDLPAHLDLPGVPVPRDLSRARAVGVRHEEERSTPINAIKVAREAVKVVRCERALPVLDERADAGGREWRIEVHKVVSPKMTESGPEVT